MKIKTIVRLSVVMAMAAALVACASAGGGSETAATPEVITLERQPCFGFCPVYTLAIHGDGRVEYNGMDFVEVTGEQTSTIDPAEVQALADAFSEAGYFTWNDAYMTQEVTDMPYVFTSITLSDGTTKRIEHYHGDFSAPEALTELENLIDATANSAQWVGQSE